MKKGRQGGQVGRGWNENVRRRHALDSVQQGRLSMESNG